MFDVAIRLENKPGEMARMGEALGAAGVSVEGGGGWVVDGVGHMHFLFDDGEAAAKPSRTPASRLRVFVRCSCKSCVRTFPASWG